MSDDLQTLLQQATARAEANERRAALAENRCERYRGAFLQVLQEHFTDLDATVTHLLEVLAVTLDVDRVGFWTFDHDEKLIRCSHHYQRRAPKNSTPIVLHANEFPNYFAAVSECLMLPIADAQHDKRTKELTASYLKPLGVGAMLDVPVRAFGRYVGVLCNEHLGGLREWSAEDQHFGAAVATQVALAFERDRVRRTQQKLLQRSLFDMDTQLPNLVNFENEVGDRLDADNAQVVVAVARVDQYKLVADTLGRDQSIALLRLVAERIAKHLPTEAKLARIAADEFGIAISSSPEKFAADLTRWLAGPRDPLMLGEERIFLTLSIGFAGAQTGASNAEQLIADAGLAMSQARQAGGARTVEFDRSMRERVENRLLAEQDLRRGLAAREFEVYFQPIVDLATLQCVSAEALLRWCHPTQGLILPGDFIATAIESGAILELGRQALRSACEGLARIRAQTQNPEFKVTVNMSAPEVLSPGMVELVHAELNRLGLFANSITLEVTETALITDLDQASAALNKLKASGVRISLDDFGTAFSSLSWLHKLPIDTVKIDRGFVEGIPASTSSTTLVRAIADLSHAFHRDVVAEGIETEQQLLALRDMGVKSGQGFLFAHAEPPERFTKEWLQQLAD
jgi:diguanylate cyclase (GGDEF)-like protein